MKWGCQKPLKYLKVGSQTLCEAFNSSLVAVELKAGHLAVLYQLRKSPLASIKKLLCPAQQTFPPRAQWIQSRHRHYRHHYTNKKQRQWANNTDTLMWLCGCAMTHSVTAGNMRLLTNYTITENPAVNSLHFYLIYRVLASFLRVPFFF